MPNNNQAMIDEIYRLTKDNNKMLHSMRRNAFMAGFLKFIVYAILFAAPIWFYMTYVSGTLDRIVNTMDELQGKKTAVQTQFSGFEDMVREFQSKWPTFLKSPGSTTSPVTE